MTRFVLLRHAEHDWLGRGIAGRMQGVSLNARGHGHAQRLVRGLGSFDIGAIVSSPQQRARETVDPIAQHLRLPVEIDDAFDEIDFGEWTGWTFERLQQESPEAWRHWCDRRGSAQPPGGERFTEVAARAVTGLQRWQASHPRATVLVASHGDVIRALVGTVLGMSLDHLERFEVAPASVSVVDVEPGWMQVRLVNGAGAGPGR